MTTLLFHGRANGQPHGLSPRSIESLGMNDANCVWNVQEYDRWLQYVMAWRRANPAPKGKRLTEGESHGAT